MIIHDHTIANIYLQEFTERFNELGASKINDLIDLEVCVSPNPSTGIVNVKTELIIDKINLYTADGKILTSTEESSIQLNKKGIHFIKIFTKKGNLVRKKNNDSEQKILHFERK